MPRMPARALSRTVQPMITLRYSGRLCDDSQSTQRPGWRRSSRSPGDRPSGHQDAILGHGDRLFVASRVNPLFRSVMTAGVRTPSNVPCLARSLPGPLQVPGRGDCASAPASSAHRGCAGLAAKCPGGQLPPSCSVGVSFWASHALSLPTSNSYPCRVTAPRTTSDPTSLAA